jgi:hypothetical protein
MFDLVMNLAILFYVRGTSLLFEGKKKGKRKKRKERVSRRREEGGIERGCPFLVPPHKS